MAADRMDVLVGNSAAGINNPAICTFHFLSPISGDRAQYLAQALAFLQYASPAANTFFAGARWASAGGSGSVPIPFPEVEYETLFGLDPTNLADLGAFGDAFGAGDLSAIGVSMTLSLYTAIPGRHTTGRVYTPWLSEAAVTSGYVTPDRRSGCQAGYDRYVIGTNPGTTPLNPVVHSATAGDTIIISTTASIIPARLKTRTR